MTEISAKEFGKLQSDVEYLTKASDSHTKLLEKMDGKLDGMVTQQQLDNRVAPIETAVEGNSTRITALEQRNKISDASVWKKIGLSFEGSFIKFVGVSLFIFTLGAALYYIQNEITAHSVADQKALETIIKKQQ